MLGVSAAAFVALELERAREPAEEDDDDEDEEEEERTDAAGDEVALDVALLTAWCLAIISLHSANKDARQC